MNTQRLISLFFILLLIPMLNSCNGNSAAKKRTLEDSVAMGVPYELDTTKIITRGNRSFIPLEFSGPPSGFAEDVLDILKEFERCRKVKITAWKFATTQSNRTDGSWGDIEGVWIDHENVSELQ